MKNLIDMKSLHKLTLVVAAFLVGSMTLFAQNYSIQNFRPVNQDGVNVFETPKDSTYKVDKPVIKLGGAFAQQFQALSHENSFNFENPDEGLMGIRPGFNNATANLNIDVQLAEGIRMELVTYLSSRHHVEAWVKGGYIQFDALPFLNSDAVDKLMEKLTVKIGHMEINYGDGHFRRTDNGNAVYNPFVGNYIMDAFDTQIGGEVYFRNNGFLAMVAMTDGEIRGSTAGSSNPAFYSKLGYDKQINSDFRFRLTGSMYTTEDLDNSNNLFSGDRAGSRYYNVLYLNEMARDDFRSGRWSPNFRSQVTAFQINPFVKFNGLEVFGLYEIASGYNRDVADQRSVNQMSIEGIYRFLDNENLFIGARYNTLSGELASGMTDASINRIQVGAGWFLTKNVLAKLEYVKQNYEGFTGDSRFQDGQFDGIMLEAVIGF